MGKGKQCMPPDGTIAMTSSEFRYRKKIDLWQKYLQKVLGGRVNPQEALELSFLYPREGLPHQMSILDKLYVVAAGIVFKLVRVSTSNCATVLP